MSAYDNDPRVERISDHFALVQASDDRYSVYVDPNWRDWWVSGQSATAARSGDARGPFIALDEAIRELIGDPQ